MNINYHGITRDHKEWARFLGVTEQTLRYRIKHWGVSAALTTTRGEARLRVGRGEKLDRRLTVEDKARAIRHYVSGMSEDDIAGDLGVSRRALSEKLIAWGVKRAGTKPSRVAGSRTTIRTTKNTIQISIAA